MRTSWLFAAVAALVGCKSDPAPTAVFDPAPRAYAARAAKDVEVLAAAPANAERLGGVEGRETASVSAVEDLRAAAGKMGADCVVVTGKGAFATSLDVGAKLWEVVKGDAYRRAK